MFRRNYYLNAPHNTVYYSLQYYSYYLILRCRRHLHDTYIPTYLCVLIGFLSFDLSSAPRTHTVPIEDRRMCHILYIYIYLLCIQSYNRWRILTVNSSYYYYCTRLQLVLFLLLIILLFVLYSVVGIHRGYCYGRGYYTVL